MASDEAPADASDAAQQTPEDPTWKQRQRNLIDVQACSKEAVASGKPKVIIVTGPTAVGKSHTALAIAKQLNGEIISADSVQVYKGLNIGSDKLPLAKRQGIPHHMLDILDPHDDFSVGHFYDLATKAADDIISRGKVPILVGGSGLYLRWFMFGKPSTPAATPETISQTETALTAALTAAEAAAGRPLTKPETWQAAVQLVASMGDPVSAKRLEDQPNSWYRLKRVLQILLDSGKPLPEQDIRLTNTLRYDVRAFFLYRPRMNLYRRIDARCEQMLLAGLVQECCELLANGLLPDTCAASRSIGYRQMLWYLYDCVQDPKFINKKDLMDCLTDIQIATRKFCHRQYTWFRGDNMFTWVNTAAVTAEVAQTIVSRCAEPFHTGGSGTQEVAWLTKEEQKALKGYLTKLTLMHRDDAVERVLDFVRQHLPADVDPLEGDVEMRRDRGRNAQVNKMEQGSTASRVT